MYGRLSDIWSRKVILLIGLAIFFLVRCSGEGFDVLSKSEFDYDNEAVAKLWDHGSVIRGWLMSLAQSAFSDDPKLEEIKGSELKVDLAPLRGRGGQAGPGGGRQRRGN